MRWNRTNYSLLFFLVPENGGGCGGGILDRRDVRSIRIHFIRAFLIPYRVPFCHIFVHYSLIGYICQFWARITHSEEIWVYYMKQLYGMKFKPTLSVISSFATPGFARGKKLIIYQHYI